MRGRGFVSERDQRARVVRALKRLHAVPIENRVGAPGMPDVNFCEGFIECKWLRSWPKGETTLVRLPHFTLQQRTWLARRWAVGRSAWLLLQVKKEWLLFTGQDAKDYVGLLTRDGLYRVARARWNCGLGDRELRECLTRDWSDWDGSPLVNGSSSTDGAEARTRPPLPVDTE
jgi:hypothetical protein